MVDKRFQKKQISFAKNVLRRASLKWKPRNEAFKSAKVSYGKYKCADCEQIFRRKDVELDHKDPVINIQKGFIDLNEFVHRLFAPIEGWAVLCVTCHSIKTAIENEMREHFKKKKLTKKKKRETI